jgi:hypothetical protein
LLGLWGFGALEKIKLMRLIRILKLANRRGKFMQFIHDHIMLSEGMNRILVYLVGFFLTCHIVGCLWVLCAQIDTEGDTWMADYPEDQLYLTSYYFVVTTITTVGYGDISGSTNTEKIFCILIMVVGVISFSFASGSLASVMQNRDSKNEVLNKKMKGLRKIYQDFSIPYELYGKIKQSI